MSLETFGGTDTIPTLLLVEPMARMLFSGQIVDVALLSRWPESASVIPGWPPAAWATAMKGLHYHPVRADIDVRRLRSLACDLCRWPHLIFGEPGG